MRGYKQPCRGVGSEPAPRTAHTLPVAVDLGLVMPAAARFAIEGLAQLMIERRRDGCALTFMLSS